MTLQTAALLAGAVGGTCGLIMIWPQVYLTVLRRRTEGLSVGNWWLNATSSITWLVYGLVGGGAVQIVSNALCLLLSAAILLTVLSCQPSTRRASTLLRTAGPSVLWLAAIAAAAVSSRPMAAVGTLAAAMSLTLGFPQLRALLRDVRGARRRGVSADVSGVSRSSWLLSVASSIGWFTHGLLLEQPAVWIPSILHVTCAALVLQQLRRAATVAGDGRR